MSLRSLLPVRNSIATRLTTWFLLIALTPCLFLLATTAFFARRSLESMVRERLMVICDAKAAQLEEYIGERKTDARFLNHAPLLVESIYKLDQLVKDGKRDSNDYRKFVDDYRPKLAIFTEANNYKNYYLFNVDGDLFFSNKPGLAIDPGLETGPMKATELAGAFRRARALLQPVVADMQIYPGTSIPKAFIVTPIIREGALIGVAALELDNEIIFHAFNTYFGLGETGDATVAMRDGDEITYVAPSRLNPNAGFNERIRIGTETGKDMQRAVQGSRGYETDMVDHLGHQVVAAWSYLPSFRWGIAVKQDSDEAFALLRRQRQTVMSFMVLMGVAVFAVARLLSESLTRPIKDAASVAARVAAGDLTARVESTQGNDESGQLLKAIEAMTGDLRSLIGRIQHSSISLMSTATEIAATARQQGEAVSDYGASTSEAAAAVKEISATSLELLKTMNEVNDVATQTARMAGDGQGSLVEMGRSMRQLAESTTSISSKLSVISERAAHINLAVTTIAKVADQTNLLSINAAIEAEKAGEYGLGFLVVAREIRRLADQTAVATLDIERMVKEMQYSVSAGVMEMDKFSDQVRRGVDEVASIGEQLGSIIAAVQGLTGRFEQVNEGMRVQSQGAEQIREAVIHLSEGAHQTSISLREFNKATDHLREAVGGLKEEVSRFMVDSVPLNPAGA